jgi:hypothetical protein
MKAGLLKLLAATVCVFPLVSGQAVQISGTIGFNGTAVLDGTSGFSSINASVLGGSQTGDYGGIPGLTAVTWTPFTFAPPASSVTPLWSLEYSGITYSFDATSVVVNANNPLFIDLSGAGIAHIDGFEDTPGTWTITTTSDGLTFTFGAGTTVPGVPDGGAMALLLGLAMGGLVLFRKITA